MAPASSRRTPLARKAIASPVSASPQQTEEPNPPCQKVRAVLVAPGQCRRTIGQSAQLEAESTTNRNVEGRIDVPVDLDRKHPRDRLWTQNAHAIQRATGRDCRVEAGHVAGGGDTTGARHRRAMEGERLHDAENLQSPRVGPVGGMEFGDSVLAIDGKTDVRVDHAQRAGDLGTQIVRVLPSIEPTHELGADPLLRQVVIGAGGACGLVERHGRDGANGRLPVTPMRRCECRRRFRKAATMGEHMAHA